MRSICRVKKVLLLTADTDRNIYKSSGNLPKVSTLEAYKPSTYEIVNTDVIVIQESALDKLQGSFTVSEEVAA
jgi:large subunit ribosomal protein L4